MDSLFDGLSAGFLESWNVGFGVRDTDGLSEGFVDGSKEDGDGLSEGAVEVRGEEL